MCEAFGHCGKNAFVDDAVRMLVQQMYKPTWEPSQLLHLLSRGLKDPVASPDFQELLPLLRSSKKRICCCVRSRWHSAPSCGASRTSPCYSTRWAIDCWTQHGRPSHWWVPHPCRTAICCWYSFERCKARMRSARSSSPIPSSWPDRLRFNYIIRLDYRVDSYPISSCISSALARQVQRQTFSRPLCLRPHSLYALHSGRYFPDLLSPRILLSRTAGWARNGAGALVRLLEAFAGRLRPKTRLRLVFLGLNRADGDLVAGIARPFEYKELRRYRGAVPSDES